MSSAVDESVTATSRQDGEPEPAVLKKIHVEVAYALPDRQVIIPLEVEPGTTLEQAVALSGIVEQFPGIDLDVDKVGIFSKLSKRNAVLREHDRVEIYRKLIADPKKVRKARAAQGKKMKKGGGEGVEKAGAE
ncbi:MAG TPA: RnfH family protein [Gammaproteobacteria bacterium]|nr:RnfH family protein [Gammaproteobacteria bacterium]